MSLEEWFITYYQHVFGERMWWDTMPKGMSDADRDAPFAILQHVGGPRRQYVDDTEQPSHIHARVRVEVWGKRRLEVSAAARELIADVMASNGTSDWYARVDGEPFGDHNVVLDLYGSRLDVIVTYRNPDYDDGPPETYYLLDDAGNTLTAENGDRLTWR